VWQEGDVLTFLHRSKSKQIVVTGGIQKPLNRIGDSDLWALQLQMNGWEKALVTYVFLDPTAPPGLLKGMTTWRGKDAPAAPKSVDKLEGQIVDRTVKSVNLKEDRNITVYLPPNAPKKDLPAFYMADGQGCQTFAKILEPLILAGKVKPVAIVGLHSIPRGPKGEDFRSMDYLPGIEGSRFDQHAKFVVEEVAPLVEKEFGISNKREDRAVFGFSNGGSFSVHLAQRYPSFIGASMPLSVGFPADEKPNGLMPRYFFAAGTLESFIRNTQLSYERLTKWGAQAEMTSYVAGHDPSMWQTAFAEFAPKIFPSR
jgi:enterochelin esterase-like enzyme